MVLVEFVLLKSFYLLAAIVTCKILREAIISKLSGCDKLIIISNSCITLLACNITSQIVGEFHLMHCSFNYNPSTWKIEQEVLLA